MLYIRKCLILVFFCFQQTNPLKKRTLECLRTFLQSMWEDFIKIWQTVSILVLIFIQEYLLATSDFAKTMQTDINHYVTRDRINDASFRQKLDPISKNILSRQNPLELVFEDISTFDAENPIVGSLLREIDIKKNSLILILLNLY